MRVLPIESFRPLGVDAFVTSRIDGVSEGPYASLNLASHVGDEVDTVAENRRRVARAIGVDLDHLVIVRQIHASTVLAVLGPLSDGECDGLVTSSPDLALAMLVADCIPILLADERTSRLGVVHAGWRGLSNGVLRNAVDHFDDPRSLHAFLGPAISVESYQIGPEVAGFFGSIPGALVPDGGDRSRLDLRRVAAAQLNEMGLADQRVSMSRQTTDGGQDFFSDRAERPCGRFALVAKRAS